MKNTNLKWKKNTLSGINSRLDTAGNKIRQIANVALEAIQIRHREEKGWGRGWNEQISVIHGTMSGSLIYVTSESWKGENRKKIFEEKKMAETFPGLVKIIHPQIKKLHEPQAE